MKIISNFQDYYDSIQQYGIDNKIVYNRINKNYAKFNTEPNKWFLSYIYTQNEKNNIDDISSIKNNLKIENPNPEMEKMCGLFQNINYRNNSFPYILYDITATINGKAYKNYLLTKKTDYEEIIFLKNATPQQALKILQENSDLIYNRYDKKDVTIRKTLTSFLNQKNYHKDTTTSFMPQEEVYKLHKKIDSPVFFIIGTPNNDLITANVPLTYLGFNHLFQGNIEIISQEISYCLGNIIKNNNEPPIAIDDSIKIEQHGFDKKISFRHRR